MTAALRRAFFVLPRVNAVLRLPVFRTLSSPSWSSLQLPLARRLTSQAALATNSSEADSPSDKLSSVRFSDFALDSSLISKLRQLGFDQTFGVQAQTLNATLAGRDVIARAATGTGKTLAFVIPIIQRLGFTKSQATNNPRALILAPTRELASQTVRTVETLVSIAGLRVAAIYGGVESSTQIRLIKKGVDIVIGTPGRINDLIDQGYLKLNNIEIMVLDEADQLMVPNFMDQIEHMFKLTKPDRQTLLFSATMPPNVQKIVDFFMKDEEYIDVAGRTKTELPSNIQHQVLLVPSNVSRARLVHHLVASRIQSRTMIFTNTKNQATDLREYLTSTGVKAVDIHGDRSQAQREAALRQFRTGQVNVIVATDVAARGIDISDCDYVIQTAVPNTGQESYIHRSGRTGRAGRKGTNVLLVSSSLEDAEFLSQLRRAKVPIVESKAPALDQLHPLPDTTKDYDEPLSLDRQRTTQSRFSGMSRGRSTDRPKYFRFGERDNRFGERDNYRSRFDDIKFGSGRSGSRGGDSWRQDDRDPFASSQRDFYRR